MSKRFGRNQRRKARALISHLQESVEQDSQLIRVMNEQIEHGHYKMARVAQAVGRNAVISGEWSLVQLDSAAANAAWHNGYFELKLDRGEPMPAAFDPINPFVYQDTGFQTEMMHLLKVQAVRDLVRREVKCEVQLGAAKVCYCFSASVLRNASRQELQEVISKEVTRAVVDAVINAR